jgi:ABC-type uncharacterized transport system permease subunit
VSHITILLLYLLSAVAFAAHRLPTKAAYGAQLLAAAVVLGVCGLLLHAQILTSEVYAPDGLYFSIAATLSFVGMQMALIALLGSIEPTLRGMAAGLLALAGLASTATWIAPATGSGAQLSWQIQAHIIVSMFAYGLLTVGAIVAVFSLVQDRRLRAGKLSSASLLFAPLETTEKLLYGVAAGGFVALLIAVTSGFMFVDNLFAQHLVHKTVLSLLALVLFGILVTGRQFAGWRGKRAVYLYLWGFFILCLAYFGSRYVLEQVLGRSWG